MTSDELADEVVDLFNDLSSQQFNFTAVKPEVVAEIEADQSEFAVYVIAKDETDDPLGDTGNTCKRTRVISVAATGEISSGRPLGKFLEQNAALREALEDTDFDEYTWDRNDIISLWDLNAAHTKSRFLSLFEATYYTFS